MNREPQKEGVWVNRFGTVGFLALIVFLLPVWPYSQRWGYQASVGIGGIFIIFVLLNKMDVI